MDVLFLADIASQDLLDVVGFMGFTGVVSLVVRVEMVVTLPVFFLLVTCGLGDVTPCSLLVGLGTVGVDFAVFDAIDYGFSARLC